MPKFPPLRKKDVKFQPQKVKKKMEKINFEETVGKKLQKCGNYKMIIQQKCLKNISHLFRVEFKYIVE